jgi:hypothetical protein
MSWNSPREATQHRATTAPTRGIREPLHPSVMGSMIGAMGATAFVLANRASLGEPWPLVALILWVILFAAYVTVVFLVPRRLPDVPPPAPHAGLIYVASIIGMVGLMMGGSSLVRLLGRPELQPAVVVVAVGLHFIPFAGAFKAPVFRRLGVVISLLGVAGLVLGGDWTRASAVTTGLVILALMTLDALRDGSRHVPDRGAEHRLRVHPGAVR